MTTPPTIAMLAIIGVTSGVSEAGEPFIAVRATAEDDRFVLLGQLTPDELRQQAMYFLAAAEAAETDALVYKVLGGMGMEPSGRARFIALLREARPGNNEI